MKFRTLLSVGALGLVFGALGCGSTAEGASTDTRNHEASLPSTAPFETQGWKVISFAIQRKQSFMFVLYGNDAAVASARAGQSTYPKGSLLSLVTWKTQPHDHWYGGTAPGELLSVEQLAFTGDGEAPPTYAKYEGSALKKRAVAQDEASERAAFIAHQQASAMP